MSEHSKLPWKWKGVDGLCEYLVIDDPDITEDIVLEVNIQGDLSNADRDFILKAVNNHDKLAAMVERLEFALLTATTQIDCNNEQRHKLLDSFDSLRKEGRTMLEELEKKP